MQLCKSACWLCLAALALDGIRQGNSMKEGHIPLRAAVIEHWPIFVATTCHSTFLMPLALLADSA